MRKNIGVNVREVIIRRDWQKRVFLVHNNKKSARAGEKIIEVFLLKLFNILLEKEKSTRER